MKFMLDLSKNIKNIKILVEEFSDLPIKGSDVYFKEHPLNYNFRKKMIELDFKPEHSFSSFFKHWNFVLKIGLLIT